MVVQLVTLASNGEDDTKIWVGRVSPTRLSIKSEPFFFFLFFWSPFVRLAACVVDVLMFSARGSITRGENRIRDS